MAVVVWRGKRREELEGGGRRTTARRGVEGNLKGCVVAVIVDSNCGLKKKGENEKEKSKGGMEKSEWAEARTGVGLKGDGGGNCAEGQGREGGRSAEQTELGNSQLGVVVEVGEKSSEVDD